MATLACLVAVPCVVGVSASAVNQPNSGALFRAPTPQPTGVDQLGGGGTPLPTGPQVWPI